jgi:hypothetical protein
LDTGSEIGLISSALVEKEKLDFKCTDQWLAIQGLGGKMTLSKKRLETVITFENSATLRPMPIRLHVIESKEDTLTIGTDFLRGNSLLLDYRGNFNYAKQPALIIDPADTQFNEKERKKLLQAPLYYRKREDNIPHCGKNNTDYESSAYVKVGISGTNGQYQTLLDTGSPINILSAEVYREIMGLEKD